MCLHIKDCLLQLSSVLSFPLDWKEIGKYNWKVYGGLLLLNAIWHEKCGEFAPTVFRISTIDLNIGIHKLY